MYDETSTQNLQASRAPSATNAKIKSDVKLDTWLENIRRDVMANCAAIPVQSASPTVRTIADRLKVLDELRASGAITEDEYAKKRTEILDSL